MPTHPSPSSGRLPMPGTASFSWPAFCSRISSIMNHRDAKVVLAFWLFGLINNVLYVIILSAAQDLVGSLPKSIVLLADVMPAFGVKLLAPYFIHRVPYAARIVVFCTLSVVGMLLVAMTPPERGVATKMLGVVLASLSSGGGELSFLGLTHYYGRRSLAGWGSGTGAAGLVGSGMYVCFTEWWGMTVRNTLLLSACLPGVMLLSFFGILPRGAITQEQSKDYEQLPGRDVEEEHERDDDGALSRSSAALLETDTATAPRKASSDDSLLNNLRRIRRLIIPFMTPLLLVYVAEYLINQAVAPTLLFPLEGSPFHSHRAFYPTYSFLYQLGVFTSRSSISVLRIRRLYPPTLLQVLNLAVLTAQSMTFTLLPSVWVVFAVVFWEGLLGGAVYVNAFAGILEDVDERDREFSLGAASVSDSAGICIAGLVGMVLEPALCGWQVRHGRKWCMNMGAKGS